MSFREDDNRYRELRAEWCRIVSKAHHPGKGIVIAEVDSLMLISYRMVRHIRKHLNGQNVETLSPNQRIEVPLLPQALKKAREIIENKSGVVALYLEAEKLEALSRSAYRWLKENEKLIEAK